MSPNKPVVVLFGMTGAGKTAVANILCDRLNMRKIKNTTTRPQRGPEDNEYNFSTNEEFMKDSGRYVAVRCYHTLIEDVPKDHCYGVDKLELDKGGLLITDFDGFKELLEREMNVVGVYIHADTETRLRRSSSRPGFKVDEFNRRNADDLLRFDLTEIISIGKSHNVYIVDNGTKADLLGVCNTVEDIIQNFK